MARQGPTVVAGRSTAVRSARKPAPAARVATPGASCPILPLDPDQPLGDSIDSLRGIDAVAVFTDYLSEPGTLKGRLRRQVRQRAEERLRSVGLRILSKQELEREPGKPRLEFYLSPGDPKVGCPFRVSISLRQEMVLGRETDTALYGGTWSEAGPSRLGLDEGAEIETIAFYLESFITDWRTANSTEPRESLAETRSRGRRPEQTWGQWLDRAFSVNLAATFPLRTGQSSVSGGSPSSLGPNRQPAPTPTFSTTLGFNWLGTGLFGQLTFYRYWDEDSQQPWNPDFGYAFGYNTYQPGTFSLTYGNYGGNRFNPDGDEHFTQVDEGSIRAAYNLEFEDRLFAPLYTDETRFFQCEPAVTTTPSYFDQGSNSDKSFKTSLSLGCRYNIWRGLYLGATAYLYPDADQQQDWDPDYTYSFGWSNWRPGTFSLEYGNYAGNRWPWREGGSSFSEGAISLNYRVPLEVLANWFSGS